MDSKILSLFPFIEQSVKLFDDQNRHLKKIILTGKICALEKAANLFTFTEKTIETFSELKEELIPLLIRENLKKYTEELRSKGQISIDILVRNLFERTADVGFLATDTDIIAFLNGEVLSENLQKRMTEYSLKYTVYDNIMLIDIEGNILFSLCKKNLQSSHDPILSKALHADGYVEQYATSDLGYPHQKSLLFAQKIVENRRIIGILVLSFRFEDEINRIFKSLLNPGEHIFFTDGKEIIASSSSEPLFMFKKLHTSETDYLLHGDLLLTPSVTKGYEGYFGNRWTSVSYLNIRKSTLNAPKKDPINHRCTLDDSIKSIIAKADDVIEDLSDVIINGELIASKKRAYVLTPVLDNLRTISSAILETIKNTVDNLENTIMDGLIYEAEASSKLAVEIMDRNLYERANDCRWWALTPIFIHELSSTQPNRERLREVLSYINGLYTVYTNLFIYNTYGTIIAASNDLSFIDKKIFSDTISKTLSNNNSQNYFVTPFEKTPYYHDEATYIYNATIRSSSKVLGGIAIVFDSTPQFKAILNDSFPHGKSGFSCIVDRRGTIITTTHPTLKPTEILELNDEIKRFSVSEPIHRFLTYDGVDYLVGIALSRGYREYKIDDNYKNDLLALTFIRY